MNCSNNFSQLPVMVPRKLIQWCGFFAFLVVVQPQGGLCQRLVDQILQVYDNQSGIPLPGAAVSLNGTPVDVTDSEGKVLLSSVRFSDSVRVEYPGYADVTATILKIRRDDGRLAMDSQLRLLADVVVWGRRDDASDEIPQLLSRVDAEAIAAYDSRTTADALELNNQAFVQRSQSGGGSIVLRGFEANKVLLVVDGVRMNNAIYRNGHLQNAITVDPAMLDQIEVIYGPGSLIYGSDALGGVVHFRTREPRLLSGREEGIERLVETRVMSRVSSASNERKLHADVNVGTRTLGFVTSLSVSDFGHLRAGGNYPSDWPDFGKRLTYAARSGGVDQIVENSNPNLQVGTAYNQLDFMQKVRYRIDESNDLWLNIQYSTSSDIPRYDQLIEPDRINPQGLRFAEWYYGPQNRVLTSVKWRTHERNLYFDKATFIASWQQINEDRLTRLFGNPWRLFNLESVQIFSLTGDFDLNLSTGLKNSAHHHLLAYGFEISHNLVQSEAGQVNIESGEYLYGLEPTRYPSGNSTMGSGGIYANYTYRSPDNRLTTNSGLRFSLTHLSARFQQKDPIPWPESYLEGVTSTNTALTWALGAKYKPIDGLEFRGLASTAFRSPNIDDFGKVRPSGDFIQIPNIQLDAENALNGELTIAYTLAEGDRQKKRRRRRRRNQRNPFGLTASVTGYYTYMTDAIVRANADLFGDTILIFNTEPYRVQTLVNATEAYVYGISTNIECSLGDRWGLTTGVTYTRGREINNSVTSPLAHIPPVYGSSVLTYTRDRFRIRGSVRFNGAKPLSEYRLGASDNEELATPDGALAWTVYSLFSSYELNQRVRIQLGIENLTDLHYRPFSAGVSAPGRNFILSVYWKSSNE